MINESVIDIKKFGKILKMR